MTNAIIEIIIIILILVSSISVLSISMALLLFWLDNKGVIQKLGNLFKKRGKEK